MGIWQVSSLSSHYIILYMLYYMSNTMLKLKGQLVLSTSTVTVYLATFNVLRTQYNVCNGETLSSGGG